MVSPVYHGGPDHGTGEQSSLAAPAQHHPQSQEASVVLTVNTDLLLINWIDGGEGSEGITAALHYDISALFYLMASN